jgi:hypothetical protein
MLNRRSGVLAGLVVAGACAIAAYGIVTSSRERAEPSAMPLAASSVVALQKASTEPKLPDVQVDKDGPKPSAFSRPPRATDAPLARMPQLAEDVRRIATARTSGVEHAVFVGNDSKGLTCVLLQESPLGRGGGGCNPSRNPFHGSTVMWSSTHYNEDPQKLVVFGVVTDRVGAVSLTFDGEVRTAVPLSEDGGFIYVVTKPVIEPTDVPEELITFDSKGREIERTTLGITFGL